VRLELDVALVFSANPEDYTARGKIVTPLKDRMGSEIRTHYPQTISEGIAITRQESWSDRGSLSTEVANYIYEIVEQIAFVAREDKKVDKRSGVSQRSPSLLWSLLSRTQSAARSCTANRWPFPASAIFTPRCPASPEKIELEYEGEMKGADVVVREIIRSAILRRLRSILRRDQHAADRRVVQSRRHRQDRRRSVGQGHACRAGADSGLLEKLSPLGVTQKDTPEKIVAAAEFLLEGLYAHKKLSRSEERASARRNERVQALSAAKSVATNLASTNSGSSAALTSSAAA